jgi:tetratricopeptide (TPR) repeat protein
MNPSTQLDTLEAKGLIRLASIQPELEYLFRHWLVQDAAYGSLLRQERRELHRLVGEALESLYPDRSGELAGILAMHFEHAGETDKALRYLLADGRYGLERNAIREAFSAFDRALSLLPPEPDSDDEAQRRLRVEVQLGRAKSSWTFRPVDGVIGDLASVIDAAEATGDLELIAQVHLHIAMMGLESGAPASEPSIQRSLDRVAEIGVSLDDPSLGALPLALIGLNQVFVGPIREGVKALEEAIPYMEQRRDFIGAAFARGWLAIGYATLGEFDKAETATRYAIEQASHGDVIAQIDAQIADAMVRAARGELDEALPIAEDCVARSQATGATACTVVSSFVLGDLYQRQGRYADAQGALQQAIRLVPVTGADAVWRPTVQAWLGLNAATLGDPDAPDSTWDESLATARQINNRPGEAGILWKRAEARVRRGDPEAAIPDFETSASLLEADGARPNLARVLRGWGEALHAIGRAREGDEKLARALTLFEEMNIRAEADEVRALQAQSTEAAPGS